MSGFLSDDDLREFVGNGGIIESRDQMTEGYLTALKKFILIQVDNEIFTYFNYGACWAMAPDRTARMGLLSVLKDELAHIQIGLRVLEDLGEDTQSLVYERDPSKWRSTYSTQVTFRDFVDLAVSIAFVDRAGSIVIEDGWRNCSYGPYRRSLRRAALDQRFHQKWGFALMQRYANHSPGARTRVQEAVDFFFPLTVEHFGTTDNGGDKLYTDYGIKKQTSNEYRQIWLGQVVPFLKEIGIRVPSEYRNGSWELDFQLPVAFDQEEQQFRLDQKIGWDEVLTRWKNGGIGRLNIIRQVREGGPAVLAPAT